jgi:hypothetical protein
MGTLANERVVDPVLTELARGYTNAALIGTVLFPEVEVTKEGGKIPQFNKEAFKIYNTERAIRANSNRISPEGRSTIDYALTEHDLEYPMDYREIDEDILNLKSHAALVTSEGIQLRHEKMIADLVQDLNTFPTGNKMTLAAADQFTDKTSDPIGVFETAKEAVRSKIAKLPNVAVLGASSFNALKQHPAILDKIKYTQHAIVTKDLLASLLGFDKLVVAAAVYADDAGSFSDMFGDNVILAYVPQSKSKTIYEPAFGYTLKKKNYPVVDSYEEKGKILVIRNTNIFTAKVVGAEAGYLINDTNA